jgi:hypothetical protein
VDYSSRQNTAESSNIEDHYDKFTFLGDELEDNRFNRLLSENKTAEYSGSEGNYLMTFYLLIFLILTEF